MSSDRIVALAKVDIGQELSGVLLITPSAVMFDPTNPSTADDGLILPMGEVKRAALYHINNNKSQAWLQVIDSFPLNMDCTFKLFNILSRFSFCLFDQRHISWYFQGLYKGFSQVSGASVVAYFGIESGDTAPLLRCLQKWSAAKYVATPALPRTTSQSAEPSENPEPNSADFALCTE